MRATSVARIETPTPATTWDPYPSLYEINTWIWITDLGRKYGKGLDLSSVPSGEWDAIAAYGFDSIWLMGVWERSPAGIAIANQNSGLLDEFRRTLPDFRLSDNVGSPYCVHRYVVDRHLGGPEALAIARQELSKRGMNLILDFVPNHVAPDHPWVLEHPEYFIRGNGEDKKNDPSSYLELHGTVLACGRDPNFPAWPDVLQLNAFEPGLRAAAVKTISSIAQQCDGIRCDMAMLFLNSIFERTWGLAEKRPTTEYWADVIAAIKNTYPGFIFIAEAYWDLEWELQQQGFDFCYDKKLYDRLQHSDADSIRLHLSGDLAYQRKLLRFIENHDEPRAAVTFSLPRQRAAALITATLPGIKLLYEGQFEGRKIRPPVFLGRRPSEPVDENLLGFYEKLLEAVDRPVFREGQWKLCQTTGWPDNGSFHNLLAWSWMQKEERYLVVVNYGDVPAQALVQLGSNELGCRQWHLRDVFSDVTYERNGGEMLSPGLFVDLAPWNFHFFQFLRA